MDVIVVGGGVIGLTVAWRLAQRGTAVTLLDPDPARSASQVAAGMLAPVAEVARGEEAVRALSLASAARWPDFAAELARASGADPGYTTAGTLIVARDGDDLGELNELLALQLEVGLNSERLSSRQARKLEPALAPSVRGALWLADDHQVDNRMLMEALGQAAARAGVAFVAASVEQVGPTSIVTADGTQLAADAVVVATGAWVPPVMAGEHPGALPVRPVKGQILRVQATADAVMPTRTVWGFDVYVVPRAHGEIVIGATVEERGFDTSVTVGAVHELLRDAWRLVPGLSEARFVEATAGLRPGTPDNLPIIGRIGAAGPVVALGHHRHGILLAPVTADLVVGLLDGTLAPADQSLVAPFASDRFAREEHS
jgi:glycine oxidase